MRRSQTTSEEIQDLSARSGVPLELTHDAAFLVLDDVEWYAILPSVGGAA